MKSEFEAGELPDLDGIVAPSRGAAGEFLFTDANPGHAGAMAEHVCGLVWANLLYGADIVPLIDPAYDAEDVERIVSEEAGQ